MEAGAVDAFLAGREADVRGLREGVQKRVIWAGAAGVRTPVSVVFVHGFSASSGELSPLCEMVAEGLGANLHHTRLAGHGQDGPAMGEPDWGDWMDDTREALDVGRAIGERVIVISCSTGGTLVTLALGEDAAGVAGSVFISPNFGMTSVIARALLAAPFVRKWGPLVLGRTRGFEPQNALHAQFWTLRYPTKAVFTMDDAVRAAARVDVGAIEVPAYFVFSDADRVVHPERTRSVAAKWGGATQVYAHEVPEGDDENAHVLAGAALSANATEDMAARILAWAGPVLA